MTMVPRISKGVLAVALGLFPILSAAADPCPAAGDETVAVKTVETRLELRLVDGRLLRLAGFDPALQTPADPDLAETARVRLAALVAGRALAIRLLSSTPDRWGRLPALAFVADDPVASEPGGLAATALAAGLGRYLAEPAAHPCRDGFLAAETRAREARLGLWADPYYAVLAVDDLAAFAERAGTVILAEGRLIAVVSGPYRTKLRFAARDAGRPGGVLLAATMLPHTRRAFKTSGVDVDAMVGRTIRLRGLLDLRFGPQIELGGPDEVVVVSSPLVTSPAVSSGEGASGLAPSP